MFCRNLQRITLGSSAKLSRWSATIALRGACKSSATQPLHIMPRAQIGLLQYVKPQLSLVIHTKYSTVSPKSVLSDNTLQKQKQKPRESIDHNAQKPVELEYGSFINMFPKKMRPYLFLTRIDKPIGTWLLYWPCAWGIGMATYSANAPISEMAYMLALFGTGAVVMRGAGCTINDMWDVKYDRKVERTKIRPLASGIISKKSAFVFLGAQLSVALGLLLQLSPHTIMFALSSMPFVVIYPYMKRITYWPQAVLGLAFNWGALVGWSAITGGMDFAVTLPLYIGGVSWTLVYDTIYGHQDKKDDIIAGVKSTSLLFGENTKAILSAFSASTLSLICLSGYMNGNGLPFYATVLGMGGGHLIWQLKNVDIHNPKDCWNKFKSNTWFGAIVFGAILADLAYDRLIKVDEESDKSEEDNAE